MTPARNLNVELPVDPRSPGEARRELAALAADLPDDLRWDLQLLVSELVANSVRHAALDREDIIMLRARIVDTSIRVEVSDHGHGFQPERPTRNGEARSGLWLVNRLADRWGVVRDGSTLVWFETDLQAGTSASDWEQVIEPWPASCQTMARDLSRLYGPPDDVTRTSLRWWPERDTEVAISWPSPTPAGSVRIPLQ